MAEENWDLRSRTINSIIILGAYLYSLCGGRLTWLAGAGPIMRRGQDGENEPAAN